MNSIRNQEGYTIHRMNLQRTDQYAEVNLQEFSKYMK